MENELKKCLLCPKPFCATCPAGTEVRRIIELVRAGKIEEAGAVLFDNNPLSAITGAVCPNHLYCKGACVLSKKGDAVDFSKVEREVSRQFLEHVPKTTSRANGKKVLIAGSGPAGLSLSYYLAKAGFSVTIFEKEQKLGGMMRYGIPDFRLDKSLIDKVAERLKSMGVKFRTGMEVDLDNLPKGYDITVLAIGAWVSRKLEIEGEQFSIPGLEFLKHGNCKGGNVVVIGGGNVAVDCALTAVALGAAAVDVCYRKDESAMKAYPEEIALAKKKGVNFKFNMVPKRISEEKNVPHVIVFDCFGKEECIRADHIIVAIGQTATKDGMLEAANLGKNVFAIGDAVTGPSTIVQAVAQAKELAGILLE